MVQSFVTISEFNSIASGGLSAKLAVRPMEDPAAFVPYIEFLRLDDRERPHTLLLLQGLALKLQ
jgi:hypothetical protein